MEKRQLEETSSDNVAAVVIDKEDNFKKLPFGSSNGVVDAIGAKVFETLPATLAGRKDIGTATAQGTLINTSETVERGILTVLNPYLTASPTELELSYILAKRTAYKWTLTVGDRRTGASLVSRIVDVANWNGEDVTNKPLDPVQIDGQTYNFVLTFNGSTKKMKLTDRHAGGLSLYGAIRGLTITPK